MCTQVNKHAILKHYNFVNLTENDKMFHIIYFSYIKNTRVNR